MSIYRFLPAALLRPFAAAIALILITTTSKAQVNWNKDGNSYTTVEENALVEITLPSMTKTTIISAEQLAPLGLPTRERPENARFRGRGGAFSYEFSNDRQKVLIYTKPVRIYHDAFYSCWVFDRAKNQLTRVAQDRPAYSVLTYALPAGYILNAKLSPDGTQLAYVYDNNIYTEDLQTHQSTPLTTDGNDKMLNGWFDYAYSEELYTIDGFRWSPDSKSIAYWQNNLAHVGIFYLIDNTDSIYSRPIPIPFSKVGTPIAEARIGVVTLATKTTKWMNIEGDPASHYLPRMEWTPDGASIIVQQLNRAQNDSKIILCSPSTGEAKTIYDETDAAWIDIKAFWAHSGGIGWDWIDNGKAFIWASEKDGWRHLYRITLDGKETLLTEGAYDVTSINGWDEKNNILYFGASPDNATQRYLYRTSLNGAAPTKHHGKSSASAKSSSDAKTADLPPANIGSATRVTEDLPGTHSYVFSPNGRWAEHSFSSHLYMPANEWLEMPANKPLDANNTIAAHLRPTPEGKQTTFFRLTTADGVTMDGWVIKPKDFDSTKKYPVIFYTYSEPAGASVSDVANAGGRSSFFSVDSGYIFVSVEGRGTPVPKGRAWRKAAYKSIGWTNVNDQAAAAREVLKWPFTDPTRVAVFGSSGGGSTTQNLLFRYPDIYKVGLAAAGVPNQLIYNTIYEERFMGVLPENRDVYIKCNPLTYAKNLKGHLLIMHGTGDHNVNYQGEEMLLNELIKYNRHVSFMPYPNRTHGITEGEGTILHKTTLMADFLRTWCPPGGR